jgi:hypothetical protein
MPPRVVTSRYCRKDGDSLGGQKILLPQGGGINASGTVVFAASYICGPMAQSIPRPIRDRIRPAFDGASRGSDTVLVHIFLILTRADCCHGSRGDRARGDSRQTTLPENLQISACHVELSKNAPTVSKPGLILLRTATNQES